MAIAIDPRFVIELQPTRAGHPSAATYRRRRLVTLFVAVALLGALLLGAESVLAGRGDGPASVPAAGAAGSAGAEGAVVRYVVQPGDTLWSIARRMLAPDEAAKWIDDVVAANGASATIDVGQVLTLPG
ncbi:MAG: LysM peptidoglycan-binding domain-containing protein [Ilumatobacteraceae bacterium]|nr:MAG: LysM peptidoglycan-binding domain-containing protein [Actinomycetota bacterium]